MTAMRVSILLLACVTLAACGAAATGQLNANSGATRQPIVAPVAHPVAPEAPSALPVPFSHVPPGSYRVHLHSICSGSQAYHLAYLPALVVGTSHSGQVLVPSVDFGRGWCVIVYADAVHNVVLETHQI
jgi:hypothetical protein